jgi:hypothetical protein
MGVLAVSTAAGVLVAACNNNPSQSVADCSVATATSVGALAVGQYVTLDPTTGNGCFGFPANASSTDSAYYLVIAQSGAAIPTDSSPFVLNGVSSTGATAARVAAWQRDWTPQRSNAAKFDAFLHGAGRPWNAPPRVRGSFRASVAAAPPLVGSLRSFVVCANPACSDTTRITARAVEVGTNVAIYIDTINPAGSPLAGFTQADLDTLLQVFDTRIYAIDIQNFGPVSDIDSNGVVIALMSPVVNQLVTRTDCEQNGYIAGFFFAGDLYPGLSQVYNNGEIYYSVVPDPDSVVSCAHPVLSVKRVSPPTFAHELEHMINFGQHVLVYSSGNGAEEGWLDEGLARYAEELAARSYLPGDSATFHSYLVFGDLYDAYQYYLDPGASYLLLVDDNGTLAESGASWLFVRYLIDLYGPGLAAKLVQSPYSGPQNITARTFTNFQTLVTHWALANYVSDLPGFPTPDSLKYTSWSFRAVFDTLYNYSVSHFPLPFPLVPTPSLGSAVSQSGELRSGSGYYEMAGQGPSGPAFALSFTQNGSTALGTTIVPRLSIIRIR